MKSKIIAVVLTGMMLMPTVAYAKGQKEVPKGNHEVQTQVESKTVNTEDNAKELDGKGKGQENKAAIETFKSEIKAKHEIMKANTQKSIELKKQISTKKQELASILSDIKAGTKTLSADQLALLTSKATAVKETVENIKALPTTNADAKDTQEDYKGKKFENALASLDKVIAKQEARYAKLVELNTNLDALLTIARQAQSVTTDTTTTPATTTDTTTTPTTTTDTTTSVK